MPVNPNCLSERVTDWFVAAVERIDSNMQQLRELEQTSSREVFWSRVRSEIESLHNENAFLRVGYELLFELRDALINGHRERTRDADESVATVPSSGIGAGGAVSSERFSVVGARSGRTDSTVPNRGRPPVRHAGDAFVPAEYCQDAQFTLTENQVIREFIIPVPVDNRER